MPENTVKVDRSTRWGNPFKVHGDGYPMSPETAVDLFSGLVRKEGAWLMRDQVTTVDEVRQSLRGKNLACWCAADSPCHADVLLRLANEG